MKCYVVAMKWDSKKHAKVKYIAGEFPEYHLALWFKEAYNKRLKADAKVVTESELVNA